jgi:hypothetical protein
MSALNAAKNFTGMKPVIAPNVGKYFAESIYTVTLMETISALPKTRRNYAPLAPR